MGIIYLKGCDYNMKKTFIDLLDNLSNKNYMYYFLTYLLSPVITGVKPSSTITLKKEIKDMLNVWNEDEEEYLKMLGLKHIILKEYPGSKTILIYNENNLKNILCKDDNKNFLSNIGYSRNLNLNEYLSTLKLRYEKFHCPHELGIFLGIPLSDVKAFMDCSKEKCLMCGYWKVYENEEFAKNIFNYYDKSKEIVMSYLLSGLTLDQIIPKISNFYDSIAS